MTKQADLLVYLFEGRSHLLARPLKQWMEASTRFTAFVDTYRDKIRKKIRVTQQPERTLDLGSELEVAYCLLNDRRFEVAYEPYASAKKRSPDFAITYRTNLVFNLEVARIQVGNEAENGGEIDLKRKEERILHVLLDKLEQMQPGMGNLLVIHTGQEVARLVNLSRLMQETKTRAEKKDPAFYTNTRYTTPADFYKDFLHLSGLLLWAPEAQLWVNKQARPGLDEKVMRMVSSLPPGTLPP